MPEEVARNVFISQELAMYDILLQMKVEMVCSELNFQFTPMVMLGIIPGWLCDISESKLGLWLTGRGGLIWYLIRGPV